MITIEKGLFFGNKYNLYKDEVFIGEIQKPFLLSSYSIFLNDEKWVLKPISLFKSGYKVEKDGEVLLTAKSKFSFKSEWIIQYKEKEFRWLKTSFFSSDYQLLLTGNEQVLGNCRRTSIWASHWESDFPPNVDSWFQLALFCLIELSAIKTSVVS